MTTALDGEAPLIVRSLPSSPNCRTAPGGPEAVHRRPFRPTTSPTAIGAGKFDEREGNTNGERAHSAGPTASQSVRHRGSGQRSSDGQSGPTDRPTREGIDYREPLHPVLEAILIPNPVGSRLVAVSARNWSTGLLGRRCNFDRQFITDIGTLRQIDIVRR